MVRRRRIRSHFNQNALLCERHSAHALPSTSGTKGETRSIGPRIGGRTSILDWSDSGEASYPESASEGEERSEAARPDLESSLSVALVLSVAGEVPTASFLLFFKKWL